MNWRFPTALAATILVALITSACGREKSASAPGDVSVTQKDGTASKLKPVKIVIDWQPSAEYYGFFFAKSTGRYAAAGYDVELAYGKGAPAVAAEVGTGSASLGTTTSDNLVRWVAKGGSFSKARALLAFNPAVVVSLSSSNIKSIGDLKGRRLGTNPESSVYTQFLKAAQSSTVEGFGAKEDPTIGWSGISQLRSKSVDAILAYTTNVVVDLDLSGEKVNELFLGDYGIKSYGLVLVATGKEYLSKAGLDDDDVKKIFDITSQAYDEGYKESNIPLVSGFLRAADPGIAMPKVVKAIEKIGDLNSRIHYPLGALDEWVEGPDVSRAAREKALQLFR